MKVVIILGGLIVVSSMAQAASPEEEAALRQFRAVAKELEARFSPKSPVIYDVLEWTESPTGRVFSPLAYQYEGAAIDVKKTDSLISPLTGVVKISVTELSTSKCGKVKAAWLKGFASAAEAEDASKREDCWSPVTTEYGVQKCDLSFNYAYQDSAWINKSMTSEPLGCVRIVTYAMGTPIKGRAPTQMNERWSNYLPGVKALSADPLRR